VSRYGFDASSLEAMALLQAYNKTHGQLQDLQPYLDAADKRGGIRGRMWPRKYFDDPRRLAMDFVSEHGYWSLKPDDCATLRFHQDDWYVWDGTKYVKEDQITGIVNNAIQAAFDHHQVKWRRIEGQPLPTADLAPLERLDAVLAVPGSIYTDSALMAALAQVRRQDPVRYAGLRERIKRRENIGPVEHALPKPPQRAKRPKPEHVNPAKVAAVMQHLEALPECRAEEAEDKLVALKNGLLDVQTEKVHPHTALRFSTLCLPFEFDPKAKCPRWMQFLAELWPSDQQSIDTLHDWFGLVLARDTSLQKMLLIVGPKRAGKGTISKVLTDLLGLENVTSPTMAEFSEPFGLEAFLGKSLGIIPDARLDGHTKIAVIERLLSISGEDRLTINRKYRPALPSVRLRTLLMVLTNETPRFPDKSGALASRFIALQLTETFYDKEETTLEDTLRGELPGIFNWALMGMRRVMQMQTKKLIQPDSGQQIVQDLHSASSPIHTFAEEIGLVEGPDLRIGIEDLFDKWRVWCSQNGHHAGSKGAFGKSLRSVPEGEGRQAL
jgi:P4 family phage/plasmid primase-like protien